MLLIEVDTVIDVGKIKPASYLLEYLTTDDPTFFNFINVEGEK